MVKLETTQGKWFGIVDAVVGIMLVIAGCVIAFDMPTFYLEQVLRGLFIITFGAAITILGLVYWNWVAKWAAFTMTFLGKGLFYLFLGLLCFWRGKAGMVALSIIIMVVGGLYIVGQFIRPIPPPVPLFRAHIGKKGEAQATDESSANFDMQTTRRSGASLTSPTKGGKQNYAYDYDNEADAKRGPFAPTGMRSGSPTDDTEAAVVQVSAPTPYDTIPCIILLVFEAGIYAY